MKELKEEVLLRKSFLYFWIPSFCVGILGCYFPYVFAILATNESDICTCGFFYDKYFEGANYLILQSRQSFPVIQILNSFTTQAFQCVMYTILIVMIYRIRHIKDDTLIKVESLFIIGFMIAFDFILYGLYLAGQFVSCYGFADAETDYYIDELKFSFWATIIRDTIIIATIVFFSRKVVNE